MDMPKNRFKRALASGQTQIGIWNSLASAYATEVVAGCGLDWMLLDTEHAPSDVPTVLAQLQAAAAYPIDCVVRPAWNDHVLIKRYLDIGVQSLLIPFVQNADEARAAVKACRYPPHGIRGVTGGARHNRFGRVPDYFERVHDELCILVQAETLVALEYLEEILAVDGVDGVFIGPADLSADMGFAGTVNRPEVRVKIEAAIRQIRGSGKAAGFLWTNLDDCQHWIDIGTSFLAVASDLGILARASDGLTKRFKS